MKSVYLSLGSNVGDRVGHIRQAIERLNERGVEVRRVSSLYKTEPVDFRPQPWFVNCAVEAATELLPRRLLNTLQGIERSLGRRPGVPKGPRPIDIDILLYENAVIRAHDLVIPHPRLSERRFVLLPLRELDAGLRDPVTQRTVAEMLHETPDSSQVIRIPEAL